MHKLTGNNARRSGRYFGAHHQRCACGVNLASNIIKLGVHCLSVVQTQAHFVLESDGRAIKVAFAHGKHNAHFFGLRDRGQKRVGGAYKRACVDKRATHDAVAGGFDGGTLQIDAGTLFIGPGHAKVRNANVHGALRIVPGFLAGGLGFVEPLVSLGFAPFLHKLRFNLLAFGDGSVVGGTVRILINQKERIAFFDAIAFLVGNFFKDTGNLCAYLGLLNTFGFAQCFDPDVFIGDRGSDVSDGNRRALQLDSFFFLASRKQQSGTHQSGASGKTRTSERARQ